MLRELGSATAFSYRMAGSLFVGAVSLWAGVAFFELTQHAVEWRLGMFTDGDRIEPGFELQTRMGFEILKVAAVLVCAYLVPRFLYLDREWKRVLRGDRWLLRGVFVAIGTGLLSLAAAEIPAVIESRVDVIGPEFEGVWIELSAWLLTIPLFALFPWSIGLIAGDHAMTLRKSVSAMHGRWIWATMLTLACLVPSLVPHLLLNHLAHGAPLAVTGLLLLLDSVLVGFIALLFGSVFWTMYRFRVLDPQTCHQAARPSP